MKEENQIRNQKCNWSEKLLFICATESCQFVGCGFLSSIRGRCSSLSILSTLLWNQQCLAFMSRDDSKCLRTKQFIFCCCFTASIKKQCDLVTLLLGHTLLLVSSLLSCCLLTNHADVFRWRNNKLEKKQKFSLSVSG